MSVGAGRVGIVADSAASLPPELAVAAGIHVVPMQLTVGERSGPEDAFNLDDVMSRLAEGVSTSGPSPAAFVEAIRAADEGGGVVVLTVSAELSSTTRAAEIAADASGRQVRVVDTGTAAGAEGLVVLEAARAARGGEPLAAVAARARWVADRVRLVAAVDSLEQLARGGRIPDVAARAGRYLDVRPLFELRGGRPRPLRPVRGKEAARDAILAAWRRSRPVALRQPAGARAHRLHVAALHALDLAAAEDLLERVRAEVAPVESFIGRFSPVMLAHTGPGVRGLAWWWEETPDESPTTPPGPPT